MRAAGTYFEQVPRTVIEKILAQQDPPAELEAASAEAVTKRTVSSTPNHTKSRISKP